MYVTLIPPVTSSLDLATQSCELLAFMVVESASNPNSVMEFVPKHEEDPIESYEPSGVAEEAENTMTSRLTNAAWRQTAAKATRESSFEGPMEYLFNSHSDTVFGANANLNVSAHPVVPCLHSWNTFSGDLGLGPELVASINGDNKRRQGAPIASPELSKASPCKHCVRIQDTVCEDFAKGPVADQEGRTVKQKDEEVDIADFGLDL